MKREEFATSELTPKERASSIATKALNELTGELAQGESATLKRMLQAMSTFPDYSFNNCMLIVSQKPDATHVAGYRAWKKLGRQVRRGEKGIIIIAPMKTRRAEEQDDDEESLVYFRAVRVFDISQTEGEPLPEIADVEGDPGHYLNRLKAYVSELGIAVEYRSDFDALGRSSGGTITLVPELSDAQHFHVLAHELAHELLHHDGVERSTKSVRETEAEAVAYVVATSIGLEPGSACSDYIQLYDGDEKTLTSSLERVRKTASRIIAALAVERLAAG